MPTAVCCPCICCSARVTCSWVQQSCRNTAARLRRRGLSEREKRSMHCRMAGSVISERDEGFVRFMSVVMADRTVSSLWLDRQFVTKLIPLLCRMMSRHSGSILRLHSPPENMTRDRWWTRIFFLLGNRDNKGFVGVILTHSKLHEVLILLSEHVQEEIGHLKLLQILHVIWVVRKVGQVSQHLLLRLWCSQMRNVSNNGAKGIEIRALNLWSQNELVSAHIISTEM